MKPATTFPYIVIIDTGNVEKIFEYWNLANARDHFCSAKNDSFSVRIMHKGLSLEYWEKK